MTSNHPGDVVELAPQLPSLQEAATQEQHQLSVEEQQKQVCYAPPNIWLRILHTCHQLLVAQHHLAEQTVIAEYNGQ